MNLNKLVPIEISKIYEHPDNPRKELGDISELTESIRKKGIMQNLTVIPGHYEDGEWKDDCYTLIIGHRRCAAAKAAGLETVPCIIMEQMDKETQRTMMISDNMASRDSTLKVIFDIETTGLNPEKDEILQFSAINQYGEVLLNTYVHPLRTESWDEAERINRISKEMVENAPGFDEIKYEVQEIFDRADELIAYNGSFDMEFLKNNGIEIDNRIPYYDVMKEFAPYYGEWSDSLGEYKWQKLTTCASFWGFEFEAHDSMEDVKATLHAYERLHMPENDYSYVEQIRNVIPDSYVIYVMRDMNKIFQEKFQLKNLHEFIYDDSGRYRTNLLNQLNEKHAEIEEKLKYADSHEERDEYRRFNDMIDYVVNHLLAGLPEEKLYYVEIKETLSRIVEVDAESREDAEIKVQEEYRNEHIVLDAEDMKESTIKIYEEEQKEGMKSEYKEMER